jgi:hypothetical protein
LRTAAERAGVDRKTARRYAQAAEAAGLVRDGGVDQLTDELVGAGLGDEAQIHVVLSATALCINGGDNHPRAVNKESVNAAGEFAVQNGKANFSLSVTARFQPDCSPPMTVAFTNSLVLDPDVDLNDR